MIEDALNQEAKWYKKIGQDAFAKSKYAETATDILVRFIGGMKLIKDKNGKEVVSQGLFYCINKIGIEDIIEYENVKYTILNFKDSIDIEGSFEYRRVWV